jgi:hypothetical protein
MLNYLERWIVQLRWQRLEPFQKLAAMLLDHLEGILNYCRTEAPLGVGGSDQREHQSTHAPWTRISKLAVPTPEKRKGWPPLRPISSFFGK